MGTYNDSPKQSGSSSCTECDDGSVATTVGSVTCTQCPAVSDTLPNYPHLSHLPFFSLIIAELSTCTLCSFHFFDLAVLIIHYTFRDLTKTGKTRIVWNVKRVKCSQLQDNRAVLTVQMERYLTTPEQYA